MYDFNAIKTKNDRKLTGENWVRNISSRPLDKAETHVLSFGLKHSVTPRRIPTEPIVSSVEAVLSRQRDLLPRYNQPLYLTITWRKTNNKHWNDWKTTTTLLYYQPTKDVWLLLWTKLSILTKRTHLLTTNKLTKNLNATLRQHCNVNRLNSKILNSTL